MDNLSLMERFADPALFEQLDASEKLSGTLVTTIMGMGITFCVLVILWALIVIMTKILKVAPAKATETQAVAPILATVPNQMANEAIENVDADSQLVAVLMAAIAASEGTAYVNHLVIRKISRVSGGTPTWGKAGVSEAIDTRRF